MRVEEERPRREPRGNGHGTASEEPRGEAGSYIEELAGMLRGALADARRIHENTRRIARLKVDRARLRVREGAYLAALGVLGAVLLAAMLGTAGALLVLGLAGGVAALFGGIAWVGALVAGIAVIGGALGVLLLLRRRSMLRLGRALEHKYGSKDRNPPADEEPR